MAELPRQLAGLGSGKLTALLLYKLQQGPVERKVIEGALKAGKPIPEKFANAPSLQMGLELYWNGYEELASFANLAANRTPILWADANAYTVRHGFSDEQRDVFMFCVSELEGVIKQHLLNKRAADSANQPKSAFAAHSRSKQAFARKR